MWTYRFGGHENEVVESADERAEKESKMTPEEQKQFDDVFVAAKGDGKQIAIAMYEHGKKVVAPVTAAVPAGLNYPPIPQHVIDLIADTWDGCLYDGVGEMIDIGASIRRAMEGIGGNAIEVAAPAAPSAAAVPESQPADVPGDDATQEWEKLTGAVAWHLIDRHGEDWNDIGNKMEAWGKARFGAPVAPVPAASEGAPLTLIGYVDPAELAEMEESASDVLDVIVCHTEFPGAVQLFAVLPAAPATSDKAEGK